MNAVNEKTPYEKIFKIHFLQDTKKIFLTRKQYEKNGKNIIDNIERLIRLFLSSLIGDTIKEVESSNMN